MTATIHPHPALSVSLVLSLREQANALTRHPSSAQELYTEADRIEADLRQRGRWPVALRDLLAVSVRMGGRNG